jgi:predicted outer membrane protein
MSRIYCAVAEVEMGKLARDKSSNASVKEFGAMMVTDHSGGPPIIDSAVPHR